MRLSGSSNQRVCCVTIRTAGTSSSATTSEELEDILAVRELVEGLEAEIAAPRLADADISKLRVLHEGMVSREGGAVAHARLSTEFHDTIGRASGRNSLFEISKKLRDPVAMLTYVTAAGQNPALDAEHAAIVDAAERRDPTALREAVQHHIRSIRRTAVEYLREQGASSARLGAASTQVPSQGARAVRSSSSSGVTGGTAPR